MNQVGQILDLTGTAVVGSDLVYVWKFWDGDVIVTTGSHAQKVLNVGGTLSYEMQAIDAEAHVSSVTQSVVVNAPPVISYLALSDNDRPATYNTTLTAVLDDPEEAGDITVFLGSTSQVISSPGTAVFNFAVDEETTLILSGTDAQGGISRVPIELRVAPPPIIYLSGDAKPSPARIGPGQTVVLSAFGAEQTGATITSFEWDLTIANGWAADVVVPGTPVALGGGSFNASATFDISGQVGGPKTIILKATTASGSAQILIPVTLEDNNAPVVNSLSFPGTIQAGTLYSLGVNAVDPDGDLLTYRWWFTDPPGTQLFGNPIITSLSSGTVFSGSIEITDALSAVTNFSIPKIVITSPLTANGASGQAFTYQITAMGFSPITFAASGLPTGLSISGNIISGTPQNFGNVDVIISATSVDGTDTQVLKLSIAETISPPPPPVNLQVFGIGVNPTYSSGQSLPVTWSIVNDNPNLAVPSTVLEFRTTGGTVVLTVEVPAGTTSYTLTNAQLVASYGGQPNVVIRAYSKRTILSQYYQEITVVRV